MRFLVITAILFMLLPLSCNEQLESISQVSKFRILGVKNLPPEIVTGEHTSVTALFAVPEKKTATALFLTMSGLITPSSSNSESNNTENTTLSWEPVFVPIEDGVADRGSDLVIPKKSIEKETIFTTIILACAGGTFDLSQLAQIKEISKIKDLCKGDNAESILAFKTFLVSQNTINPNKNPEITTLEFNGNIHPAQTKPEKTGFFECEGSDGCRDSVAIKVQLSKESYQLYEKEEFGEKISTREYTYVSWFSDGGEFSNDRSGTGDVSTMTDEQLESATLWYEVEWFPPKEGGIYNLWVVAHDLRGGIHWQKYEIEAIAPK